jgi:hypothetical protein
LQSQKTPLQYLWTISETLTSNFEQIIHSNISLIRNFHSHDEEETERLTLPQETTEKTKQGMTETNKKQKTHTGMNKSASLTPVQGPSTVVCMIVT